MQSLRIAAGLFALVTVFFLAVPERPALLGARTVKDRVVDPAPPSPVVAAPSAPQLGEAAAVASGEAVRTVGPVPFEAGALTRLPVASGAAAPPRVGEGETTAAADEAPATPAPMPVVGGLAEAPDPGQRAFARPIAVDAGTLKAGEVTLIVAGVEPVAREARCTEGAQAWPCATRARTALRGWLRGRSVFCAVPPEAAETREITAACRIGEEDVGDWVVRNGWGRAAPGGPYEAAEREARQARRGVWAYGLSEETSVASGG